MDFRITGLDPSPYRHLFGQPADVLKAHLALRHVADAPNFPDRVSLGHVPMGTPLLLLHHQHQAGATPYRASHAIYVAELDQPVCNVVNEIPVALTTRLLSIRAFDADHMMVDADVIDGALATGLIHKLLAQPQAAYLQVHFAKRGCYAARVERAVLAGVERNH